MAVVQSHGVPALIHSIVQGQGKEEILEPAICALRHITCRHSHASEAQDAVRQASGLPMIVELLNANLYSWPLVKSTISLIRNLALSTPNLPVLREIGAVPKLAQLLVRTHQELQKQPASSNGPLIDNYIRMDDVLEACVSAIHMTAKDQQNRNLIRDLDCIPLFVRVRSVEIRGKNTPIRLSSSCSIRHRICRFNGPQREFSASWSTIVSARTSSNRKIVRRS